MWVEYVLVVVFTCSKGFDKFEGIEEAGEAADWITASKNFQGGCATVAAGLIAGTQTGA